MSMVLYTSPEVEYIVMDSLPENNNNDVYGISIWYFCSPSSAGGFAIIHRSCVTEGR